MEISIFYPFQSVESIFEQLELPIWKNYKFKSHSSRSFGFLKWQLLRSKMAGQPIFLYKFHYLLREHFPLPDYVHPWQMYAHGIYDKHARFLSSNKLIMECFYDYLIRNMFSDAFKASEESAQPALTSKKWTAATYRIGVIRCHPPVLQSVKKKDDIQGLTGREQILVMERTDR